jgi:hypothetical protein
VTEQKLNLFEFSSGLVAEPGASATKIVGRQMVNADSFGISLHGIPVRPLSLQLPVESHSSKLV